MSAPRNGECARCGKWTQIGRSLVADEQEVCIDCAVAAARATSAARRAVVGRENGDRRRYRTTEHDQA